jgi:hypothetical protein
MAHVNITSESLAWRRKRPYLFLLFTLFASLYLTLIILAHRSHLIFVSPVLEEDSRFEAVQPRVTRSHDIVISDGRYPRPTTTIDPDRPDLHRIAYITFTHLNGTQRFENMIINSVKTWVPAISKYFVVLSDIWREQYTYLIKSNYSSYVDRIYPVFVDCPEGSFGHSPCCKQEKGLAQIFSNFSRHFEWFGFFDDDMYMRHPFLRDYVSTLPSFHEPIVLASGMPPHRLGQSGYMRSKTSYQCSRYHEFSYPWGQPVIYNFAAIQRIHSGLILGGLVKQCLEFNVTHDVGNAILHWMYMLKALWIPVPFRPDRVRYQFMGLHGVGRCKEGRRRGCNMESIHSYYTQTALKVIPNRSEYKYEWHNVSGFLQTRTYQKYGDPATWSDEWYTLPTSDCNPARSD